MLFEQRVTIEDQRLISRLADMFFAFPGLLLAILVAAIFGPYVTENYGSTARLVLVAGSIALLVLYRIDF